MLVCPWVYLHPCFTPALTEKLHTFRYLDGAAGFWVGRTYPLRYQTLEALGLQRPNVPVPVDEYARGGSLRANEREFARVDSS